jgi:hypothetical protein
LLTPIEGESEGQREGRQSLCLKKSDDGGGRKKGREVSVAGARRLLTRQESDGSVHTVPQAEAEGGAREGRRVAIVDNLNGLSSLISSCRGIVSSLFPVSLPDEIYSLEISTHTESQFQTRRRLFPDHLT